MLQYEIIFPHLPPMTVGELQKTDKGWETVQVTKPFAITYTVAPFTFQDHYDRIMRNINNGANIEIPEWLIKRLDKGEGDHTDFAETINHIAITCGVNRDLVKLL